MRSRSRARSLRAAFILLALLPLASCGAGNGTTSEDESQAASTLLVRTAQVRLQSSYRIRETYAGRIESRRSSNLGFDRAGRVVSLAVDEGDLFYF